MQGGQVGARWTHPEVALRTCNRGRATQALEREQQSEREGEKEGESEGERSWLPTGRPAARRA